MHVDKAKEMHCPYQGMCTANKCMAWRASSKHFTVKEEIAKDWSGKCAVVKVQHPDESQGYCSKFGSDE